MRANYLASPPLVVAYALAGTMDIDLTTEPLGHGTRRQAGVPARHLADAARRSQTAMQLGGARPRCSATQYADVFDGDERWQRAAGADGELYAWDDDVDLRPASRRSSRT